MLGWVLGLQNCRTQGQKNILDVEQDESLRGWDGSWVLGDTTVTLTSLTLRAEVPACGLRDFPAHAPGSVQEPGPRHI